jgi:hypothetical protein
MQDKKTPLQDILTKVENHDLEVSRNVKDQVNEEEVVSAVKSIPKKKPKKTVVEKESNVSPDLKVEQPLRQSVESEKTEDKILSSTEATIEKPDSGRNHRLLIFGTLSSGLIIGFMICYFFFLVTLQNQVADFTAAFSNGNSSSNQMKSDLSTTKLKQQEMEIRYQAVSDQLESANQYIFLLRMKEQIALAQLMVEQKEGLKARQSLSEIQNRFEHLKPFILKKDTAAAEKLDTLIKSSIQHLVSDPESIKSDLDSISDHLNTIEATLFQLK